MASKIGIGIGVKIDDIKKVKDDLTKQIGNIKGLKAKVSNIEIDNEKIKSQIESKFKSISKDLKIKLKGIEIEDNVKQKITNQIQRVLNSLGKDISIKVKDIELADSLKSKMQSKLNQALKGVTVKIANVEFDVTKIDTLVRKTKEAQQEIKQIQNVTGKSLNIGDGAKSFEELQRRARQIREEVDSLAKISFTTNKNGGIDKAMITYTDSLGKVVTETMGWKQVTSQTEGVVKNVFTTLSTKVNENVAGLKNLEQQVASTKAQLQRQLNVAKAMGMDESVINSLQAKLNSLNVNNFKQNIAGIKQAFQDLGVNSVNNISRLQNAINTLQNRINHIKNTKMDIIKSNDITELREAQNQVQHLKNLMNQVKSGKIIDGKIISAEINTARNSMQQLNNSIRQATASGTSLKTVMGNIMSYTLGGGVTFFALNQVRDGLKTVKEVDTAMRDLKRVTDDVSENTLSNFSSKANEIAKELGSTTEEAITATTVWKQMGYSFNEASQFLAKQSMILGNVGDMSSKSATDALVSTLKAFKIEAKDTEMVVDSLNEAGNKFAVTTGDLAEGLRIGASSLALANNDLYQSEALIVAGTEVLRDSNAVANGLKTISMRLNQIKTEDGDAFYKLKKELHEIADVDLTDTNDNLRSTYDVILDLSKKWNSGELGDMEKSKLLDDIAGKHQAKVLSAIIQNAEQLPKIYDAMKQSAGSAAEEQARYMDSIEGKMNALKETSKSLWINMIDSNSVKVLVDISTSVVGAFDTMMKKVGAFPTVTTAVVGALTIFNSKFRESSAMFANMIPGINNLTTRLGAWKTQASHEIEILQRAISIKKATIVANQQQGLSTTQLGVQLSALNLKLALVKAGEIACTVATVALQAAMTMGLSLAITGIISGLTALGSWLFSTGVSMNDCSEQAQKLSDSLDVQDKTPVLMEQYKNIYEKLKDTNLEEDKRKQLNEELAKIKTELSGLDDEYKWILEDQNKSYEEQLNLLNLIAERKKNENAKELDKEMSSQSKMNTLVNGGMFDNGLMKNIELYKKIQDALTNQDTKAGTVTYNNITVSAETAQKTLSGLKNEITDAYTQVEVYNHQVGMLKEANYDTSRSMVEIDESTKEFMNTLVGTKDESDGVVEKFKTITTAVNELTVRSELTDTTIKSLQKAFPDLGINAVNAAEKVSEFKKRIEENASAIQVMKAEMDSGTISEQSISKLSEIFPELGINADNAKTILEGLGDEMDFLASQTDGAIEKMDELSDSFNGLASQADIIDKVIEEMGEYGGITDDTYSTLIKSHPEVLACLTREGDLIENLNKLKQVSLKQMEETKDKAVALAQEEYSAKLEADLAELDSNAQKNDIKAQNDANYNQFAQENSAGTAEVVNSNENAQVEAQAEANTIKGQNDANYNNTARQNAAETTNQNASAYSADATNQGNSEQTKSDNSYSVTNVILGFWRQLTVGNAGEYQADVNNFISAVKAKLSWLMFWKKSANDAVSEVSAVAQGAGAGLGAGIAGVGQAAADVVKKTVGKVTSYDTSSLPTIVNKSSGGGGISKSSPSIVRPSSSSGGGGSKGSSGSGGSRGSSGKSEAEKAAEEAEKYAEKIRDLNSSLDIDRYFDANTAISKLENAMTDLKNSQDTLIGADLGKAKRQENEIIKQQIKAYQDLIEIQKGEQAELKATLQANGFYIDSNGKLYDSQQRLSQLQDELNAKSYASSEEGYKQKQKDIEALKELQKQVERYVEISVTDIPKATQKWNELSNSMRKTALSNLENLRDKLVDGLKKQYEDKKDKELTKIDEAYEKRKERLEKQYQKDVDSLTREKEKVLDFYQDQIDELQKQLDDLEDDSKDKQEKLTKLKQQLALWQQDDSVFAKKKIEDLNKEIADLEKEILKDSLQDQIDNLKDKKDEEENYYDESLNDLKDAHEKELEEIKKKYDKEKKAAEDLYEDLLSDKKIYAEANKLITEQNLEEIQQILRDSAEDFKEIGALLGQNFAESLREEVQTALNDFRTLTGQATVDYDWKNGDNGDKYAEKVGGFVGTTSKGNSFTYDPNGGIMSPSPLTPEEVQEIRELAKKKGISAFDTGGRTPSTIGSAGALAILHKNEKILNPDETNMLDRIYGYVQEANSKMSYMNETFAQFKEMSEYINRISGVGSTNIKREVSSQETKQVNLENNFNINNYTKSDSTFSKRELERLAIKQAKLYR